MGQAADFFSLQELSIQLDILDSCIWDCDSSGCYTIKSTFVGEQFWWECKPAPTQLSKKLWFSSLKGADINLAFVCE
jgi:hypothetical protein